MKDAILTDMEKHMAIIFDQIVIRGSNQLMPDSLANHVKNLSQDVFKNK